MLAGDGRLVMASARAGAARAVGLNGINGGNDVLLSSPYGMSAKNEGGEAGNTAYIGGNFGRRSSEHKKIVGVSARRLWQWAASLPRARIGREM